MPPLYIARLACGLRGGSRVISEISNSKVKLDTVLLAGIADSVRNIVWMLSEDGAKGQNRPKKILPILLGEEEKKDESNIASFDSGAEFESARQKILNGEKQWLQN